MNIRQLLVLTASVATPALLGAAACAPASDQAGEEGDVQVVAGAITALDNVDHVVVTATATNDVSGSPAPVVVTLTDTNPATGGSAHGMWHGTIGHLRTGHWTFHAAAYDSTSETPAHVVYATDADGAKDITVEIAARTDQAVQLELQQRAGSGNDFANAAPRISGIFASRIEVAPGDTVTLVGDASDADPGDVLSFTWLVDGAAPNPALSPQLDCSASTQSAALCTGTVSWQAPVVATRTPYTLTLEVDDGRGGTAGVNVVVNDDPANAKGVAKVSASFDTWPTVSGVTSSSDKPLEVGGVATTSLHVAAGDVDGDGISYQWSLTAGDDDDSCAGHFSASTSADTTFTLDDDNGASTCSITVTVRDGQHVTDSNSAYVENTGTIVLQLGAGASTDRAPVIDQGFQSSGSVSSETETVELRIAAHDPDAQQSISRVDWTLGAAQGQGQLSDATTQGGTGTVTWTATGCVEGTTAVVSATVHSSVHDLTTVKTFSIVCHAASEPQ